jgi:hypothetical protein
MLKLATAIMDVLVILLGFRHTGYCRSLILFHINSGSYGSNVKLEGLEVIVAVSWPKAIHEGNGTVQLFITKVPGILEVQVENFVNPVTGEEQDTKIHLPKGFIFKVADAAKTKVMRILTPNLNFDDSGKNAFYATVEFKGP